LAYWTLFFDSHAVNLNDKQFPNEVLALGVVTEICQEAHDNSLKIFGVVSHMERRTHRSIKKRRLIPLCIPQARAHSPGRLQSVRV
jgi:hypothetical protein